MNGDVMLLDFRSRLEAFLALAIGTAAGWFVLNSPGMPGTLLTFMLNNMNGFYDAFRSHNSGEIALVLFLYRIPGVLITGLLFGLILPRIRYSRLLLFSILIWPAYVLVRSVLFVVMLESGGREVVAAAWGFFSCKAMRDRQLSSALSSSCVSS